MCTAAALNPDTFDEGQPAPADEKRGGGHGPTEEE